MLPGLRVSAADYPKRTAPSNLKWGIDYWTDEDGGEMQVELPGSVSWVANEHSFYAVAVYKEGESEPIYENDNHWGDPGDQMSDNGFYQTDIESGRYYFTVTSLGNGYSASDSDTIRSATWTYTRPTAQCAAPTDLYWSWPNACYTPAPMQDDKTGNMIAFYFAEDLDEEPRLAAVQGFAATYSVEQYALPEEVVERCGAGYYYFQVYTISTDIESKLDSDWSPMSEAYHCGTGFLDVDMGAYYAQPVLWAVEEGITTGLDTTHFGPDAPCTRGQIVTFLYRAMA